MDRQREAQDSHPETRDSRHEARYEVEGEAEVLVGSSGRGSSLLRGRILDLSTAGCYVQTLAQCAVRRDSPVHIEFWVHGQFFRVRAAGRFFRTRIGIGFSFLDMDADTRRRLHLVLEEIRFQAVEGPGGGSHGMDRKKAG